MILTNSSINNHQYNDQQVLPIKQNVQLKHLQPPPSMRVRAPRRLRNGRRQRVRDSHAVDHMQRGRVGAGAVPPGDNREGSAAADEGVLWGDEEGQPAVPMQLQGAVQKLRNRSS